MRRILLLGGSGILGSEVLRLLQAENYDYVAPASSDLDIRDRDQAARFISNFKPSWIINCAAWTNVDGAEESFEAACELNDYAVENLGVMAHLLDCRVIHISTDYVFNGESVEPYLESFLAQPINKYGESKLRGEKSLLTTLPKAYVIRTSWLYGTNGKNFIKTIVDKSLRNEPASVVDDQVGSPTNAQDLGKGILAIIKQLPQPGIYHFSNGGSCSWFELARFVYQQMGSDPELVRPISSTSLRSAAKRPRFSLLSKEKWDKAEITTVIPWEESLKQFLHLHFGNT
jgi:dTDP-4-dehydrorhamnose reductase